MNNEEIISDFLNFNSEGIENLQKKNPELGKAFVNVVQALMAKYVVPGATKIVDTDNKDLSDSDQLLLELAQELKKYVSQPSSSIEIDLYSLEQNGVIADIGMLLQAYTFRFFDKAAATDIYDDVEKAFFAYKRILAELCTSLQLLQRDGKNKNADRPSPTISASRLEELISNDSNFQYIGDYFSIYGLGGAENMWKLNGNRWVNRKRSIDSVKVFNQEYMENFKSKFGDMIDYYFKAMNIDTTNDKPKNDKPKNDKSKWVDELKWKNSITDDIKDAIQYLTTKSCNEMLLGEVFLDPIVNCGVSDYRNVLNCYTYFWFVRQHDTYTGQPQKVIISDFVEGLKKFYTVMKQNYNEFKGTNDTNSPDLNPNRTLSDLKLFGFVKNVSLYLTDGAGWGSRKLKDDTMYNIDIKNGKWVKNNSSKNTILKTENSQFLDKLENYQKDDNVMRDVMMLIFPNYFDNVGSSSSHIVTTKDSNKTKKIEELKAQIIKKKLALELFDESDQEYEELNTEILLLEVELDKLEN